jgi:hypothetical protein
VNGIKCLIFYDAEHDVAYLILFTKELAVTRVVGVKNKQETILWCGNTTCV